jgi:YVTN family beta-propeller protein
MRRRRLALLGVPVALLSLTWVGVHAAPKKPVYIGARLCAECHSVGSIGNQYSRWLQSRHSKAYSQLAKPEALEIAKLSGLRTPPQESAICLGCHATAWHGEEWEKDPSFHIEDGVQCERCHGPGSEYASAEVMRDRAAAMKAGLQLPTREFCLDCHKEKGSHVAVLKRPPVDLQKGWEKVKHPISGSRVGGGVPQLRPAHDNETGAKYAGAITCGKCHRGAALGNQWSVWRRSAHSDAWADLATEKAKEIARKLGVDDPQSSPQCLKCHATGTGANHLSEFSVAEGVGCEACHGAGSDYSPETIMRDKRASANAGLKPVTRETCMNCHPGHGEAFDYDSASREIAHPTKLPLPASAHEPQYKTPIRLALRPRSNELYVTCEASDTVIVVNTVTHKRVAEIKVGGSPTGITFSPDGKRAFVTNRHDDSLSVIDTTKRERLKDIKVGNEPHGVLTDRQGKLLYVANTSSNDIFVFDTATLTRVKTLSGSNGPWSLALSPDGSRILVSNMKARFAPLREPFVSEVTRIETERAIVDDRAVIPGANLMMGVAWHPSGEFALATLNRTKGSVPMTRLLQGWTITNGLAVIWRDGKVDEVLLDEADMGFADATDVMCTPDGKYALVTSAGTDRIAVIDVAKLVRYIRGASDYDRKQVLPNRVGGSLEFVARYIETGRNPRGLAVSPDGRRAYFTNSLDDTVGVLNLASMRVDATIDLGGSKTLTTQRWGEQLFHNANISFHKQFACNSCHPDGHVDSMTYDIEADGIGITPVDNRTLRGILDTAPFKWEGTNPSLQRQCGARLAVFFTRLAPFTPKELAALDYYVTTIPRPPNRFRPLGAALTPAQRRGKQYFERSTTNDGRVIPPLGRCVTCHFPPYYTDRQRHDVGTKMGFDRTGDFDVPHLNNIYDSAPYLHNGMAATLEEIWTVYNPEDKHGVTNDMTKDQLNDLIEFLKTL